MRYARGPDGSHIAYVVEGDGLPLLCVGEWGDRLDTRFDHPAQRRYHLIVGGFSRAIFFDPCGLGASDPGPMSEAGSAERWVDDALVVLDELAVSAASVLADGYGTHAAIRLAASHPERVHRLVLLNPYPTSGLDPETVDMLADGVRSQWGTGEAFKRASPGVVEGVDDELIARWERTICSPSVAAAVVLRTFLSDVRPLLSQVHQPVLVLWSGGLAYVAREQSEDVAEHLADARFVDVNPASYYGSAIWNLVEDFVVGAETTSAGRQLATVVFTDIVDSTLQAATLGDRRWRRVLDQVDDFVRDRVRRFDGRLIKSTGDGHLMTFSSPTDAIHASRAIRDGARVLEVEVRTGIHTGEIELRGEDIGGIAVHIASRVQTLSASGQILVSAAVPPLAIGSSFRFDSRGSHELKGVPGRWELFDVSFP